MQYNQILESIGLSKSEGNLYLENLKLGPSTASNLAQKLGISRQMVYMTAPALMEKGLLKEVQLQGKRLYQALSPDVLQDRLSYLGRQVTEMIPELKTKQAETNALPLISIYDSPLSMREWYRYFMSEAKPCEEMLVWTTFIGWYDLDPEFYKEFVEFKDKNKITSKLIAPDTTKVRSGVKASRGEYQKFKFASPWWQTNAEKWVWRDQVCILTIKENATNMIIIESASYAAIERFDFERIWKTL